MTQRREHHMSLDTIVILQTTKQNQDIGLADYLDMQNSWGYLAEALFSGKINTRDETL
tara:strand:- start:465 stop:638 length:174 start_codon:yes stop_codon:yes gene_type:complete